MSQQVKDFTNHWLLAAFSNLSYNNLISHNDKGWKKHLERSNPESGFFGVSFVSRDLNTIVIAFRGTDDYSRDWLYSNRCWATGCIPYQYDDAKNMFNDLSKEFPQYHKIVTGHSLGGGLAQLVAIEYDVMAVTFDSPGTLRPAQKLFDTEQILKNEKNIIAYASTVNIVNTSGEHIPQTLKQIKDESFFNYCKEHYLQFTNQRHAMQIIQKKFDESTGSVDFEEVNSIERTGSFNGYWTYKKICGEATAKEIISLHNCTNLIISNNTQKLLDGKITFEKNSITVEKSFLFFKKNSYCNPEVNGYNLIDDKIYKEHLQNIKALEHDKVYNDVLPNSYKQYFQETAINKFYHEPNLDIHTMIIRWDMFEEEVISFYNARNEGLCDRYNCINEVEFPNSYDAPSFIEDFFHT